jgi:hypothetical protein
MHPTTFHTLASSVSKLRSRRAVAQVLGGFLAIPLAGGIPGEAKKRKRKVTLCRNGETIKVPSKKKKKLLKRGASPGACKAKSCATNAECGSGAICADGTCQTCSVTCHGDSAACGAALQQRLDQGGTIYVCPGRYAGRFVVGVAKIIGAGSGEDPATDTILDAQNDGRVLSLNNGVTASLSRLHITGGSVGGSSGGGLYARNCDLAISSCVFTGNRANSVGGLFVFGGRLHISDSTISDNTATSSSGGGVGIVAGANATISRSNIRGNRAPTDTSNTLGGGIYLETSTLTVTRSEISLNSSAAGGGGIVIFGPDCVATLDSATRVVNNSSGSTRGGGGILVINNGKVNLNGAMLDGNTPDNVRFL